MAKPRLVKVRALFVFLQNVAYEKRMPHFETPSSFSFRPYFIYSRAKDIYFFGTVFGLWQCNRVVNMSMSEHKWKKCSKNMFYNTFEMRYVATGVKNN